MKIFNTFLLILTFLVFFISIYLLHINFFEVNVVLYQSIFDVFVSLLIFSLLLYFIKNFSIYEKFLIILICFLLGYSLALTFPAIIDRSLSFYILEKIDQRGGGIDYSSFDIVFKDEYLVEHRLVDVRITEQLESGTIEVKNNCVKLTDKGRYFVSFSKFFRKNLLPRKRLLMGNYSSDLLNIFHVDKPVNYECE